MSAIRTFSTLPRIAQSSLIHRPPISPFFNRFWLDTEREFDRFFQSPFTASRTSLDTFQPKFDVVEKDNKITILAELPGLSKENVTIDVHNNQLTLSGKIEQSKDFTDDAQVHHRERSYGAFSRSLVLPEGVKAEDIKASMNDGVLKIELPSAGEKTETKKIDIA